MGLNLGDFIIYPENKIYTVTNVINSYTYEITYYETPGDFVLDEAELSDLLGSKVVNLQEIITSAQIISANDEEKIKKLFQK